jgi:hypothetical protein
LQPPRGHAQCRRQSCCLKSPEMEKGAESSGSAGSSDTVASGTSGVNTVEDLATESPTSVTSASPSTPTDISFPTQETLPVFLGILINPQEDLERKEKALPPPPVEFKNPWFSTRFVSEPLFHSTPFALSSIPTFIPCPLSIILNQTSCRDYFPYHLQRSRKRSVNMTSSLISLVTVR